MVRAEQGRSENKSIGPTTAIANDSHFMPRREVVAPGPAGGRRAAICCVPYTLADHVRGAVDKTSKAGNDLAVSSALSLRSPRSIPSRTPIDAARSGP
jgi:hypothetical protein